jgi:hypothetical protein
MNMIRRFSQVAALLPLAILGCQRSDPMAPPPAPTNTRSPEDDSLFQLVVDAACLTEKNEDAEWISEVIKVVLKPNELDGRLFMRFRADEGKPTGVMSIGVKQIDPMTTGALLGLAFRLEETGGKRFLKILSEEAEVAMFEYSIESDQLTVKNGVIHDTWADYEVDLKNTITFELGRGNPTVFLKQ